MANMMLHFSNLFVCSILVLSATSFVEGQFFSIAKRADSLEVISPVAGDTIAAGAYWNIKWKSSSTSDKNVTISLRQGPSDYTQLVHVIDANTFNNGSYLWRSQDDSYLRGTYSLDRPDSGCNYSIEFRTAGLVVNSQLFALINPEDGGIQPNMSCAGPRLTDPSSLPSNGTAISTIHGGVSTGNLGAAVGGTAAGLIALFIGLLFLAKKMGWIVSASDCHAIVKEYTSHQYQQGGAWEHKQASQIGGEQIHQMP